MAWGKNGTPNTLTTAGANMNVSDLGGSKTNVVLSHTKRATGNTYTTIYLNNESGSSSYSRRQSENGASDGTAVNQNTVIYDMGGDDADKFEITYICGVATSEKLAIGFGNNEGSSAGASSAPERGEFAWKWANTSDTITRVDNQSGSGTYATGSNLSVLGSDVTPADAVPAVPSLMKKLESPNVGGWVEVGRTTLSSAGDTISVTSLSDKRYYMWLVDTTATGGNVELKTRANNDTGSNYAFRYSSDGGSDTAQSGYPHSGLGYYDGLGSGESGFTVGSTANLSGKEKLTIGHHVSNKAGTGAGTAPNRVEAVGKWANTSSALNRIDYYNDDAGDFTSGSEVVVLGWDPSDSHTTNFWEELADTTFTSSGVSAQTFTAKKYLWFQFWFASDASGNGQYFQLGDTGGIDTGSTYARRFSINGGTDSTSASQSKIYFAPQTGAVTHFVNMFMVNNASNEKLVIINATTNNGSGAGNAPQRRETVGKWVETTNQCDRITIATDAGTFTGGQLKVWGSD